LHARGEHLGFAQQIRVTGPDNAAMKLRFTKMHGAGNDFAVFDATRTPLNLTRDQWRRLGDRHLGIGADQILVVDRAPSPDVDFGYRIFNGASGDEVEHCGNGARCFVQFVRERGLTDATRVRVRTVNNVLELELQDDGRVRVDMNVPTFDLDSVPFDPRGLASTRVGEQLLWTLDDDVPATVGVLSVGNPHAVQWVDAALVTTLGPRVETHRRFARGVNAGFAQVIARDAIRLRVWERHAGETLACGTGACAAVVCGIRMGLLDARVDVTTRGGLLTIEWEPGSSMRMTGPVQTVYEGEITI
jgi:diaminopimelate epimerase